MKWKVIKNDTSFRYSYFEGGWGNGYVFLPKGHRYYNVDYQDIDVKVHGGLTFSNLVTKKRAKAWKLKKYEEMWMVGFDTLHYYDTPAKWPYHKVIQETLNLKKQLKNNNGLLLIRLALKSCQHNKVRQTSIH